MIKINDTIESTNGTKGKVVAVHWGENKLVMGYSVQTDDAGPVFVYAINVKPKEATKPYVN